MCLTQGVKLLGCNVHLLSRDSIFPGVRLLGQKLPKVNELMIKALSPRESEHLDTSAVVFTSLQMDNTRADQN